MNLLMDKKTSDISLEYDQAENLLQASRLSEEWLKVEKVLDEAGILHTVVFFGSARIEDRHSAELLKDKVQQLTKSIKDNHLINRAKKNVELAIKQSQYYEDARLLAKLVGQHLYHCNDKHTKLITGGGPGIMEAANRGAADIGRKSIGLNITIAAEQKPNPYVGEGFSFEFRYFSLRKMHFLKRAKGIVVFPGGFGTLDELMEVLTLMQTGKVKKIPIILYGKEFWKNAVNFEYLAEQQLIDIDDLNLYTIVDNVEDAKNQLLKVLQCAP
jgi:uncharacterized protein (TIGR00730 family)